MEEDEIMDKVERFLEKKAELELESCYFITKKLNESYWERLAGEETEPESDEFDFESEPEEEPTEAEELKKPEGVPKIKKEGGLVLKRPGRRKKEEKGEELGNLPED